MKLLPQQLLLIAFSMASLPAAISADFPNDSACVEAKPNQWKPPVHGPDSLQILPQEIINIILCWAFGSGTVDFLFVHTLACMCAAFYYGLLQMPIITNMHVNCNDIARLWVKLFSTHDPELPQRVFLPQHVFNLLDGSEFIYRTGVYQETDDGIEELKLYLVADKAPYEIIKWDHLLEMNYQLTDWHAVFFSRCVPMPFAAMMIYNNEMLLRLLMYKLETQPLHCRDYDSIVCIVPANRSYHSILEYIVDHPMLLIRSDLYIKLRLIKRIPLHLLGRLLWFIINYYIDIDNTLWVPYQHIPEMIRMILKRPHYISEKLADKIIEIALTSPLLARMFANPGDFGCKFGSVVMRTRLRAYIRATR